MLVTQSRSEVVVNWLVDGYLNEVVVKSVVVSILEYFFLSVI